MERSPDDEQPPPPDIQIVDSNLPTTQQQRRRRASRGALAEARARRAGCPRLLSPLCCWPLAGPQSRRRLCTRGCVARARWRAAAGAPRAPGEAAATGAAVAARTGLQEATDGSASSAGNSAASHASDGGGICVINVAREAILLLRDRLRRKLMSLKMSHQRRNHRAINGCRVKRKTKST